MGKPSDIAAQTQTSEPPGRADAYRIGEFEIDLGRRRVTSQGREIELSRMSFDVLALLVTRHPEPVSTAELLDTVWAGKVVTRDTVKQRLKVLRDQMPSDHPGGLIRNVRGFGYRLAEAQPLGAPVPTPRTGRRSWLIGGALLVLAAAAGLALRPGPTVELPLVIAVLPFEDLTGANPAFIAQLQDKLISDLAEATPNDGARVLSRSMIGHAVAAGWEPRSYRDELDVDFLFEGSLVETDKGHEVRTRFIFTREAMTAWQEDYPVPDPGAYAAQEQVSAELVAFVNRKIEWVRARQ
ncbi:MAG: winged helix-turn-helix domain-containing protein [Pseudomonadota bacterium]